MVRERRGVERKDGQGTKERNRKGCNRKREKRSMRNCNNDLYLPNLFILNQDINNWKTNTNGTSKGNITAIGSTSASASDDKDTLIYCFIVVGM